MKNKLLTVLFLLSFLIAFFPAYFGYQENLQAIGYGITVIFGLTMIIPLIKSYRWKGVWALLLVGLFGYIIEFIGVKTCIPYGCFAYSSQMWPQILNTIPWLLFFTWTPLIFGVWSIMKNNTNIKSWYYFVICTGLMALWVDMVLDPLAVHMGLWSFTNNGWWRWIPVTNFMGWVFSGIVGSALIVWILGKEKTKQRFDYGLWMILGFFIGLGIRKVLIPLFS